MESPKKQKEIDDFILTLFDPERCVICRALFDFDAHLPRILPNCGHTFCTTCMSLLHKNLAIKCVLCGVVVKSVDSVSRLPVNHTIMIRLTKQQKQAQFKEFEKKAKEMFDETEGHLFMQFQDSQKKKLKNQEKQSKMDVFMNIDNLQKFDNFLQVKGNDFNSDDLCDYHSQRSKHYFCLFHKTLSCERCAEMMHSKGECQVIDFHQQMEQGEQQDENLFNKSTENCNSPSLSVKSN